MPLRRLLNKFRIFANRDVERAFNELRRRLQDKGYNVDHPPDKEAECEGKKICVIIADLSSDNKKLGAKELMEKVKDIRTINIEIAKTFGLNPTGEGPRTSEDSLIVVYCGFRHFHFF